MRAGRIVLAGVLLIAFASLLLALVLREQSHARDELLEAGANMRESIKAIKAGNFGTALSNLSKVRSSLDNAKRLLIEGGVFGENEKYASALQMYSDIYRVLNKLGFLFNEADILFKSAENLPSSEVPLLFPRMEVVGRGILESEVYLRTTTMKLNIFLSVDPEMAKFGLTGEFKGELENLTSWYLESRSSFQSRLSSAISSFNGYRSFNSRELPTNENFAPAQLNPNVAKFFNALDDDKSKTLNFGEVQNLFYWSKWKVEYSADGKDKIMEVLSDPNYWSTPSPERIKIVANDEELSSLYANFLNYYGACAYVAFLAPNLGTQGHFVCIFKISDSLAEFKAKVGDMPSFKIEGEFGVPRGYYLILDPLSDAPFYLIGGKSPGEFKMERVLRI